MRALVLTRRPKPGTLADAIQLAEIPDPHPRGREVVVRVLASTINIDDIHVAEGTFYGGIPIGARPSSERPVVPGSDVAGIVTEVGRDVSSLRAGQEVFGVQLPFHDAGGWAELCAIDERWLTTKPETVSFGTAAACGISGLVAVSAIETLQLSTGARIVIVGVSGGIGGIAAQMATRIGANVIGICGPAHVERAYRLGCCLVIDYSGERWDQKLRAAGIRQISRVLELVGGGDVEEAGRNVLGRDGIFVTVVGPIRFIGDRVLGWPRILKILTHIGLREISSRIHGPRYTLTGPGLSAGRRLPEVAHAAAAGVLPPIDSTVPFELDALRVALRRAAAHQNNGRIVIEVNKVH